MSSYPLQDWYDNLLPEDFEWDCKKGPDSGCQCPDCSNEDNWEVSMYDEEDNE